jgi:hypothetical protein
LTPALGGLWPEVLTQPLDSSIRCCHSYLSQPPGSGSRFPAGNDSTHLAGDSANTRARARGHDSQPKRASYYALRADTAASQPQPPVRPRDAKRSFLARLKAFPLFPLADLTHRLPLSFDRRRAPPRLIVPIRAGAGAGATGPATYRFLPLNRPIGRSCSWPSCSALVEGWSSTPPTRLPADIELLCLS